MGCATNPNIHLEIFGTAFTVISGRFLAQTPRVERLEAEKRKRIEAKARRRTALRAKDHRVMVRDVYPAETAPARHKEAAGKAKAWNRWVARDGEEGARFARMMYQDTRDVERHVKKLKAVAGQSAWGKAAEAISAFGRRSAGFFRRTTVTPGAVIPLPSRAA